MVETGRSPYRSNNAAAANVNLKSYQNSPTVNGSGSSTSRENGSSQPMVLTSSQFSSPAAFRS
ncbi:hypothetical protein AAVH_12124 [Aphelenchoides avenae]|nr:hypothetical protein AAVH_12124 [Aphelenchus avenae]